ncbi:MAG TPA: RluA family pseudouridine synthase [Candidatus Methylacidiphilales bacterium]|jgi:23S rRNA pseudouridine1911/1915/1917 synthase|nr:RluA family pseudouridine synthase [Candidatus Methylacidiphilales bacterium]
MAESVGDANFASASMPRLLAVEPDFLVVAKPPDLLSHPTRPDGARTLLGWLHEQFPGEFVALVNRLDRETSGVLLAARSPEAASRLGALTMRREIDKYYLALVSGRVELDHGLIDAPIGRLGVSPENPIWLRRGVIPPDDPHGRKRAEARTEFWLLASSIPDATNPVSLLRLRAHTGRLHQLRVHLAHIGHPVIGDKIYGPDPNLYLKFIAEGWTAEHQRLLGLPRHALHAHELRFPWNGNEMAFTAPLPDDMLALIATHLPEAGSLTRVCD